MRSVKLIGRISLEVRLNVRIFDCRFPLRSSLFKKNESIIKHEPRRYKNRVIEKK